MINEQEPLFDASFTLSGEFSADWTPLILKGPWTDILGWSEAELLQTPFYKLTHPEDLPRTIAQSNISTDNAGLLSIENRILTKSGAYRSLLWDFYQNPVTHRFMAFARDVTKHKVEKYLFEKSQQVARIGSWALDYSDQKLYWTSGTYQIFGVTPAEFTPTAESVFNFYSPEDAAVLREYYSQASSKALETDREVNITRHNGERAIIRLTSRAIHEDGVTTHLYGTVQDITKEKEQNQKLLKAKEEAELATRIKSDFLANISHEIRTPMNSIIGMVDLLQETTLNEEQKQYTTVLSRASSNLIRILNDVLDLAKLEANQLKFEKIAFNLFEIVEKSADLYRHSITEKNLEFHLSMDPSLVRVMMGDPLRIQQVLNNLLANALKFTEQGSISLNVRKDSNPDFILIEVKDTGIGISPGALPHLFRRFFQVDSSVSRKYGGTGLGLSICKELVEKMGGTIKVESSPGYGSTFRFSLPLVTTD